MARDPKLTVVVDADTTGVQSGLSKSQGMIAGFSAAAGITLANFAEQAIRGLADIGQAVIDQASKLQQSTGAVSAVFGDYADEVEANADRAARAVGLSASAYQDLAAQVGGQLKLAGTPMENLADKTDDLIGLGADLAATYGGSVSDAISAVSSLLRGERDPIERYNVAISQASIDAYKAANGLDNLSGSAETAADKQATLALLFEQTADAQGMFADESDTLAGSQAILNAAWDDALAALGTALLPVLALAAQLLTDVAGFVEENSTVTQVLIGIMIALAVAVWAANAAFLANPITWIIIAIGLLIAIIVLLITNWDAVVAAFEKGAEEIGHFFEGIGDWFDQFFGWIGDAIGRIDDFFAKFGGGGVDIKSPFDSPNSSMLTFATAFAGPAPVVSAMGRQQAAATMRAQLREPAASSTNITVNGALDPQAVSKQIARLLRNRHARIGIGAAAGLRT